MSALAGNRRPAAAAPLQPRDPDAGAGTKHHLRRQGRRLTAADAMQLLALQMWKRQRQRLKIV
jgi:hypothetical protein